LVGTPGRGARAWAAHRILDAWVASAAARRLRCRSERLVAAGVTGAGRRTSGTPIRAIPGRGLPCRLRPAPGRRMPHSADLTPTAPAVQAAPCPSRGPLIFDPADPAGWVRGMRELVGPAILLLVHKPNTGKMLVICVVRQPRQIGPVRIDDVNLRHSWRAANAPHEDNSPI